MLELISRGTGVTTRLAQDGVDSLPAGLGRKRARVLVAGDQELVREALACLLERSGYKVVGQASDCDEAVALWSRLKPDIVLLDLRIRGIDGIAAIRAIRDFDGDARTIILSAFDCEEHATRAFMAGARGYVLKWAPPEALCECIDTVHDGRKFIAPELAQRLATRAAGHAPTDREFDVLKGVARGLCNKNIARALGIEEGTVKAHLKSILRKLEATSRTQAAMIAIRRGLVDV